MTEGPRKNKDITGHRYNKLEVLKYHSKDKYNRSLYECKCDCGTIAILHGSRVSSGKTTSCGCARANNARDVANYRFAKHRLRMIGRQYGRLTIIKFLDVVKGDARYQCECTCGNLANVFAMHLVGGNTSSCGCIVQERRINPNTPHGFSGHFLYKTWVSMIARCYNVTSHDYELYGGRGIRVCKEWKENFHTFVDWAMENGWAPKLSIDRYPNKDGHYEPSNCRWATDTDQARNTRKNVITMDLARFIRTDPRKGAELARELGVSSTTVYWIRKNKIWKE